jgi:hypothetical protein
MFGHLKHMKNNTYSKWQLIGKQKEKKRTGSLGTCWMGQERKNAER